MSSVKTPIQLATYIDHTLLKPDMTYEMVAQLAREAVDHEFAAVCVPPFFAQEAVEALQDSPVNVATVVGFPMGYGPTISKVEEVKNSIDKGVDEIDAVANIAAIKNKKWAFVTNDIQSVTTAAHLQGKVIKIIIETGLLSEEEMKRVCDICAKAEVDYVKTSTGFNGPGASVEVVRQLRGWLPDTIKIKASGGIRERVQALTLIEAGADRIGTSSGLQIIQE